VICVAETNVTLVAAIVPNSTVDALVKPDPLIVTTLPPLAGPELGLTPDTLGRYVNSSAVATAEVPADVVTVISSTPTASTGAVTVICDAETKVTPVAAVVPNLTVEAAVKPDPLTVTTVPPLAGPELGLMPVTLGTKLNSSAVDTADVLPDVVTVTSSIPAPAGAVAVICVAETSVTPVAAVVPNSTVDALLKPDPVIVTDVPPLAGPELGLMPVTLGT
jgi:hypothetical protein